MNGYAMARCYAIAFAVSLAIALPSYAQRPIIADPPRSIGPNKNVFEWLAEPPTATFRIDDAAEVQACLTIALSFGLGGAPVVIHETSSTMIFSLLPKTFGLVSTLLILHTDGYLEYRGKQEFELRLIRKCIKQM